MFIDNKIIHLHTSNLASSFEKFRRDLIRYLKQDEGPSNQQIQTTTTANDCHKSADCMSADFLSPTLISSTNTMAGV